jgi:hypothetical protein
MADVFSRMVACILQREDGKKGLCSDINEARELASMIVQNERTPKAKHATITARVGAAMILLSVVALGSSHIGYSSAKINVEPSEVPVFLYHSSLNSDFALLPSVSSLSRVSNPESYYSLWREPVGFVASDSNASKSMVLMRAYWSAARGDVQTTTRSLDELNAHGGNYSFLVDVGYILSAPVTDVSTRYAPLSLVYSSQNMDAITSPLNAADVNQLFGKDVFRTSGTVLGWLRQGDCNLCNVALSESFPSAGGADCAPKCKVGTTCTYSIYRVGQDITMNSTSGGRNFLANMNSAGDIIKTFDASVEPERGMKVHVSFTYLCCYTKDELKTIGSILDEVEWTPKNVTFDRAEVRIDSPNNDGSVSHYSMCVFLDEASNNAMLDWVGNVEKRIEAAGIKVNVPRKHQEPYHSTLAVVDGRTFPVEQAVRMINTMVPPGTWTGSEPLVLTKPQWSF